MLRCYWLAGLSSRKRPVFRFTDSPTLFLVLRSALVYGAGVVSEKGQVIIPAELRKRFGLPRLVAFIGALTSGAGGVAALIAALALPLEFVSLATRL
jgi:hypothetical protein